MGIAATSVVRPKIFGPKATGLDRGHCKLNALALCTRAHLVQENVHVSVTAI